MGEPIAGFVTRRPRLVIAVWIATVAILGLLGLGLDGKLSAEPLVIDHTETKRERDLVTREFGNENALFVLLRGPSGEIESQGRKLELRLDAMPRTVVVSPWGNGGGIEGLRPSPNELALLVNVGLLPGEAPPDLLPALRQRVDETVTEPVEVSVAGAPVLVDAFRRTITEEATAAERIALPLLLIILLIVFRSVLAAAIPVIIGGAVVASTRGVLDILAGSVQIDAFALGAAGMIGLALGVDYALLIVSRFREEMKKGDDAVAAAQETMRTTARSVIPAGCGLLLAMLVASQTVPSSLTTSVAIAVSVASVLSVLSAMLVVPAILVVVGTRLDRWSLPRRTNRQGAAARWSQRLSTRPGLVWPLVLFLVIAAGWAFTLDSKVAGVAELPPDDPGRQQLEDVQDALGPGWVAPVEIVMQGRGSPVTTGPRLRALAAFQRRVEEDPEVASMSGLAGVERRTRPLGEFEGNLAAQQRGLGRLNGSIGRVHGGAVASTGGLVGAAGGADELDSAVAESEAGAGLLAEGARNASTGSAQLSDGLGRASTGSGELADGTAESSAGAGKLSKGLAKAAKNSSESVSSSRVLKNTMRSGSAWLIGLHGPLKSTEEQLAAARQALEAMTEGRADPQYGPALAAVNTASRGLTGLDPASGEPVDPSFEGVDAGIAHAENQFNLGTYLANRIGKNGRQGRDGLEKLSRSSARLDRGLSRLAKASDQVSEAIARLSHGGQELSPALVRLSRGTEHLAGGLGEVQDGAAGLASGLSSGAQRSKLLSGSLQQIHSRVEQQQESSSDSQLAGSPGLFRSGYFYLAGLAGAKPKQRSQSALLVNLDQGGSAARMLVIPRSDPTSSEARELNDRIRADASDLARQTGTEVVVGGETLKTIDIDTALRDSAPLARLALCLVTLIVLIPVVRSLTLPIVAALLNLLTVGATFGLLSLLFNNSLLGGPGYVDTTVVPATIMLIFGLAIDYEVFIFARMREEYVRTGSSAAAITNGLAKTAPVITGAAMIMITVFLVFSLSSLATLRNFGVAQALAVSIDAFIIRLVVLPALMRAMGDWCWWMPGWLDRLLPGGKRPAIAAEEG